MQDDQSDGHDEEPDDDDEPTGASGNDPYSNLDGAFGGYMADEPRPMGAANTRGGRHGDDDLLF